MYAISKNYQIPTTTKLSMGETMEKRIWSLHRRIIRIESIIYTNFRTIVTTSIKHSK